MHEDTAKTADGKHPSRGGKFLAWTLLGSISGFGVGLVNVISNCVVHWHSYGEKCGIALALVADTVCIGIYLIIGTGMGLTFGIAWVAFSQASQLVAKASTRRGR